MIKVYSDNGLPFYGPEWIRDREYIQKCLEDGMTKALRGRNPAWQMHRVEAPSMIPSGFVSAEYDADDMFSVVASDFYMKPETTGSSYAYGVYLLEHQATKPPFCIWQVSKSFRKEADQPTKHMRLKEFYQQEFQCIVTEDTKMDYQSNTFIEEVYDVVEEAIGVTCRIVPSDRLPHYSEKTIDIEAYIGGPDGKGRWMEVASISKRGDFPVAWDGKLLTNYEFAFGLDRLVYVRQQRRNWRDEDE